MFYFDLRHNVKFKNENGKRKPVSSRNAFHYITRTLHFSQQSEDIEWVCSGNLPAWVKNNPVEFWKAADDFEKSARTSSHITVALPKELTLAQREELAKKLISEFCDKYKLPYSAAIHNEKAALDTEHDQPHLHLLYSERTLLDEIERPAEQFFKQYRPKNPQNGGARKITADVLNLGRYQIHEYRRRTECIINEILEKYAPTKLVTIKGLELEVPSKVSCLSYHDYNLQNDTSLKEVPQIPRWKLRSSDPITILEVEAQKATIKQIRQDNQFELYKEQYQKEFDRLHLGPEVSCKPDRFGSDYEPF